MKNLFLTFIFYVQARIVNYQQLKLGDRMFHAYQSAPYEWHLQRSSSELLRNIQNDTAQVLRGVIMPFLDLIMAVIMAFVIIMVMLFSMPGPALLGLLITGAGLYIVIRLTQKYLQKLGHVVWLETEGIIKAIQQGFGALVDARILGRESYLRKVHRKALKNQVSAQLHQTTIQKSMPNAIETFSVAGLLVILIILIKTTDDLGAVLPVVVLLGVVTIRLKQIAVKIGSSINLMILSRAYIPTIVKDLQELDKIEQARIDRTNTVRRTKSFDRLVIDNISYHYPNTGTPAIKNISLELKCGESIALVGKTGCGKSTLVNLILGLLVPQSGSIHVNNRDIHADIHSWWAHLGFIPQSIFLIDDTIQANVAFGIPINEIDELQLSTALRSARLVEFIDSLPQGLDTIVGERGVRLSGGQRQRLGIARALYHDPEVLVMDEATSALDNKTEVEVIQAIQNLKKNRTLIMIAHRLSTVENCDRLYFLQNGEIENTGSYQELRQVSESFREMTAKIG